MHGLKDAQLRIVGHQLAQLVDPDGRRLVAASHAHELTQKGNALQPGHLLRQSTLSCGPEPLVVLVGATHLQQGLVDSRIARIIQQGLLQRSAGLATAAHVAAYGGQLAQNQRARRAGLHATTAVAVELHQLARVVGAVPLQEDKGLIGSRGQLECLAIELGATGHIIESLEAQAR